MPTCLWCGKICKRVGGLTKHQKTCRATLRGSTVISKDQLESCLVKVKSFQTPLTSGAYDVKSPLSWVPRPLKRTLAMSDPFFPLDVSRPLKRNSATSDPFLPLDGMKSTPRHDRLYTAPPGGPFTFHVTVQNKTDCWIPVSAVPVASLFS